MRQKLFLLFVVCLVWLFFGGASDAQSGLRVLENETRLDLNEKSSSLSLALESPAGVLPAKIKLEVLAPNDDVHAREEISRKLGRGRQIVEIPLSLSRAALNSSELLWYRLRYEIAPETTAPGAVVSGILSFSQILPEVFELKTVVADALAEKTFRVRVQAANPANQKPVGDVLLTGEIEIEDRDEKVKAEARTDREGFAFLEFRLPDFEMSDDLELAVTGKKNGVTRTLKDDLRQLAGKFVYVQTDKPIYQPAQTVNLRLNYLKLDKRPVREGELTVEIENEETDETVFTEQVKTSRFGIASVQWKIPAAARLGNYQIYVKNGDDDEIGTERIKITRYDLPNFYIEAKPGKAFYLPHQKKAAVEVSAKYLFGKKVENARVRIVSNNRDDEDDEMVEDGFREISGQTDGEGHFSAEIDISKALTEFKPDKWRRFKDLKFSAFVTDPTTNRTEQRRFDVRITREPIHVYLIGETYNRSARLPLEYYVSTFYADGTPASCEVSVHELISEDADGKEISPELGKILTRARTNSYGVGKLKLPAERKENEDELNIKLVAADGKGASGSDEREIDLDDRAAIEVKTDKTVYRKGERVKVSLISSEKSGRIFVDVVKNYQLLYSTAAALENGRAEIVLPYSADFKNDLQIAAYFEDDDDDLIVGTKGIIYPTPVRLNIEARTEKEIFRPGEPVTIKFRSRNGAKTLAQTALGVLVLDRAVEERARTVSETGEENAFLNRTFIGSMSGFFGHEKVFGDLSLRDIENLNLAKPLDRDLELAIEVALKSDNYRPQIARSDSTRQDLDKIFSPFFRRQMKPVAEALDKSFAENQIFPIDEKSLREILSRRDVDFASLRDAWGNAFRAEFRVQRDDLNLEIWSLGADKTPGTADDLTVLESSRKYFTPVGKAIDRAMSEYTSRTGGFITDYQTLREEIGRLKIDADALRDYWGNPYRFEFTVDRTNYVLMVKSSGANKRRDDLITYNSDDFLLWTSRADYFTATKANLVKNFNEYVEKNKTFPRNETEMREILRFVGFDLDGAKDVFGRAFYIQPREIISFANFLRYQNPNLKAVKRKILNFAVKSAGQDGVRGNYDDFELANFTGATTEQEIDYAERSFLTGKKIIRQKTVTTQGAIAGVVIDPNGAVIPNATVTVRNATRSVNRTIATNENGEYFFDNLSKDTYTLEAFAVGFRTTVITNLSIEPGVLIELDVTLEIGTTNAAVEVTATADVQLQTSASTTSMTVTASRVPPVNQKTAPTFTPRVRNYFAETLVWSPELVTDKRGRAELKFKMADSLTTWKLYAVGSTETGEFGVVTRELQTFQPFFAELDPPRILTEGDRIALPVPIRNYTDRQQKVAVSLGANDWSKLLGGATRNIEVPANSTKNAIFDFQAVSPVTDGRQKVTARAQREADAIEKPVTVKPNGREIVETQARLFEKETALDVNFPAAAFPNTRRAEVKIYPNMLAHVAESVEGLLKRPYGCGEQTTSSTYPNLLILKIEKELGKTVDEKIKAKAKIYLDEGYKRLLNYQTSGGGFSFWGMTHPPNVALTAYVLRFLHDAEDYIEVDEEVVERAEEWLLNQQGTDGSWKSSGGNSDVTTAYVARSLSLTAGRDELKKNALRRGIGFLQKRLPETGDSFVLANLALAALEIGERETARKAVEKLNSLWFPEKESVYWTTPNTPFYGWGTTANIETTALVVQALLKLKVQSPKSEAEENDRQTSADAERSSQISRGLTYLLKNKDRYGVWYSTQTTVNVLDALILLQKMRSRDEEKTSEKGQIFIDGKLAREFSVTAGSLSDPFVFDLSPFLNQNENRVEIKGFGALDLSMAQIVAAHYINWSEAKTDDARYFRLKVTFDKTEAKIGAEVTCTVEVRREIYNRYGMILAEIGLPPGADVDRASLEKMRDEDRISSYDVLPDKVVVYFWQGSAPLEFSFKFRPRFGLEAQTAPSLVYDYYNEEARAVLAPTGFIVK